MSFADNLKKARLKRGESQTTLGAKAGLEASHIGHFENERREPNLGNLRKIKKALRCTWEELLD